MSLPFHNLGHVVMAVAVATAAPSTAPGGPSAATAGEQQTVAARLAGSWDCTGSAAGSRSRHEYRAAGDTKLILEAHVHTSFGVEGDVTETFGYDRTSGVWTVTAGRNRFFDSMRLTAQAWTGNAWLLTGTQTTNGTTRVARIAYGAFERNSFVRQLQSWTNGRWTDDGTLTCRRTVPSVALQTPPARPSMQPAAAVVPRRSPGAPTPTPLPIPGILPADAPNSASPRSSPARIAQVRASASPVRPSPRPSESPPQSRVTPRAPVLAQASASATPGATPGASASPHASPSPHVTASPRPSASPVAVVPSARSSAEHVAAAHVAAAPARPTPHASATPAQAVDLAYRLSGKWACETLGGAPATHEYSVQSDGTLKLHNVLTIAKHDFGIDETYRYDRTKNVWTTQTGSGAYVGTAPKWLSGKWVFEGSVPSDKGRVPVQMIYSTLGEGAFRRDFAKQQDGAWKTFAAETCHRP